MLGIGAEVAGAANDNNGFMVNNLSNNLCERRQTSSRGSSAAELGREIDEIVCDDIEIMLGFEVPGLVGAVFERPADKGGAKPAAARRDEIAIMRRHHHALLGLRSSSAALRS